MRWANILLCCLFLAVTCIAASEPLSAADIRSGRSYPEDRRSEEDRRYADEERQARDVADFCYGQRQICRKICRLRFRDDDIGCPQNCVSRESRCAANGCYRWSEQEFLIAERFGGAQCSY